MEKIGSLTILLVQLDDSYVKQHHTYAHDVCTCRTWGEGYSSTPLWLYVCEMLTGRL